MTDFELKMQYFDLVQKLIEEKKLLEETIECCGNCKIKRTDKKTCYKLRYV